jgi:hypothetical protein
MLLQHGRQMASARSLHHSCSDPGNHQRKKASHVALAGGGTKNHHHQWAVPLLGQNMYPINQDHKSVLPLLLLPQQQRLLLYSCYTYQSNSSTSNDDLAQVADGSLTCWLPNSASEVAPSAAYQLTLSARLAAIDSSTPDQEGFTSNGDFGRVFTLLAAWCLFCLTAAPGGPKRCLIWPTTSLGNVPLWSSVVSQ